MDNSILIKTLSNSRFPVHSILKLTYKCNFKCVHCYQTPEKGINEKNELSTENWFKIIDILKKYGVLTIMFTGGEVFSRPDFVEIYKYAFDRNFKILVLSNLSMLDENLIEFFKENSPMCISTTLYGFSENTYRKFTHSINKFEKVMNNVRKLQASKIPIKVKVVANSINRDELDKMYTYFLKNHIPYFFYYNIINYVDGDKTPKMLQLKALDVIDYQFKFGDIQKLASQIKNGECKLGQKCAAGVHSLSIDPFGNMYLCELCDRDKYNILDLGFEYCWEKLLEERKKYIEVSNYCDDCCYRKYCSSCNPKLHYENLSQPSNRDCFRAHILKRLVEGPWNPN